MAEQTGPHAPQPHPVWGYTDGSHIGHRRGNEEWEKPPYEAWRRVPDRSRKYLKPECEGRSHVPGEHGDACYRRCRSWRLFWTGFQRCTHAACHDPGGKWHSGSVRIWYVRSFWSHDV